MEKRNYHHELEMLIKTFNGRRPRVLLHSCCGPCSSAVLEFMVQYFDITLLWYNPNIYPEAEFEKRYATQLELIEKMGLKDKISVRYLPHRSEDYYSRIKGLENAPEGGSRCCECFKIRLEECAKIAKAEGYDYFCTTLTLSRHKNAVLINALGEEIGAKAGIPWLTSEFKKRGGEQRSIQICKELDIYRQEYCGCEFSMRAEEEKLRLKAELLKAAESLHNSPPELP